MRQPAPPSILGHDDAPVETLEPEGGLVTPLVFSSPHSGRGAPADFLPLLNVPAGELRRSEDAWVDRLVSFAPSLGAPLVAARFCRAYVDANREPAEIDPGMIADSPPPWANTGSPRVANGLGVAPRLTVDGETIHRRRLSLDELIQRIDRFHAPYHRALSERIERARARFGVAVLIDWHSMPSSGDDPGAPDIVLGDRFGAACDPALTEAAERAFRRQGFAVHRNVPFAGGYTTAHYGRPRAGAHAIQVEISRALYLDEDTMEPRPGAMERLSARLRICAAELVEIDWESRLRRRRPLRLRAAE